MTHLRTLSLALFALLLAAGVAPIGADVPPFPQPRPSPPLPDPLPFEKDPLVPNVRPVDPKPKRTGPFRSCGSGMSTGLAGIGLAWGMLWLGTRFTGRVRGTKSDRAG